VAHSKEEDKDDGESSKDEHGRARNHWRCEKRDQRQRKSRQTKWQEQRDETQTYQKHAPWTRTEATVGVLGCKLASGTTERVERRKMIRSIVAAAQPAKLVAARAARHVVASEILKRTYTAENERCIRKENSKYARALINASKIAETPRAYP
jgi:hypothetical protein